MDGSDSARELLAGVARPNVCEEMVADASLAGGKDPMKKKPHRTNKGATVEILIGRSTCNLSGKPRYAARNIAKKGAKAAHSRFGVHLKTYRCRWCDGWHLTTDRRKS